MSELVLCIDIGTSSLKAALIDATGKIFAFNRQMLYFSTKKTPHVWDNALILACKDLFLQINSNFVISAISVSGNGPTLVCGDFLLLWNEPILPVFTPQKASPSFFLPRARYLKDCFSVLWKKEPFLLSCPEYLIFSLCGRAVTLLPEKRYENAYWTFEDLQNWQLEKEKFPAFVSLGEKIGNLLPQAAQKLGISLKKNDCIPLFCGGPDFIAALIGTNTLCENAVCDRAGSSEGLNVCVANPIFAKGLRTLPSVLRNFWNISVVLPDTGKTFADFKQKFYEQCPYNDTIKNLIQEPHSVGGILLATIAREVKNGILTLESLTGKKISRMRVTGGQANSDVWLAYKSQFLNVILEVTAIADAELVGNAIVAFYGLGIYSSLSEAATQMVKISKVFEPKP